jgi:ABC-type dipeptide/oligopeptide/nickel transport system permease component
MLERVWGLWYACNVMSFLRRLLREQKIPFAVKRAGTALVTLFLVSVLGFTAFDLIPGDPASILLGTDASEEQIAALQDEMGLNRSFPARYARWLGGLFSGDLGVSLRFQGESISALIQERLPVSFALASLSFILIAVIAFPLALFSVKFERGIISRIVNIITAAFIGIPNFFLGILFIWIFGIIFRVFSAGIFIDYRVNILGFWQSLFFPALAIAIPNAAVLVKFLRSSLFTELKSEYVRTALGKGASFSISLYRHALRNALIPSVTVLGMIIADVFSGSIIIEQVFAIPGIGRLLIAGISYRDYPLIQALIVYIAFIVIAANTFVDITIKTIDPRIRLERKVLL